MLNAFDMPSDACFLYNKAVWVCSLSITSLSKSFSFNGTKLQKMCFSFCCTMWWMCRSSSQLQKGILTPLITAVDNLRGADLL